MKKVAVLGAGFTGLTCAYQLIKKGFQVTVFEKEAQAGGLAGGFKKPNWQWSLDNSYHHLFTSDNFAIYLARYLGINIIFKRPQTCTYTHRTIVPLDSPLGLLKYPYLNLSYKLRVGLVLAYLKFTPFWKNLEQYTAKEWLIKTQGIKAWKELWEALFISKFGEYADQIAASWFWARIKKRSMSLGYPQGGFQNLADKLASEIIKSGGEIYYSHEIQNAVLKNNTWQLHIKNDLNSKFLIHDSDLVISTLPMPIFTRIFTALPADYLKNLITTPHLDALNLILELKKPFLPQLANGLTPYWLNISDKTFPFVAVVEHTNFMDKKYYGNHHILYIGNYLPRNHRYFKMSAKQLFDYFQPFLLKINPDYNFKLFTINYKLFHSPFAQPVIFKNYSKIIPPLKSPLPNLFMGNLDNVYPWDRGTNYAIELGYKLADQIFNF